MANVHTTSRPHANWLALETSALDAHVARAGMALGCSYSSSDEYEAAVIAERRAAGAYDGGRQQRLIAMAAIVTVAALVFYAWF